MHIHPILLYDIDGTLLQVQREFLHELIGDKLSEFGIQKPGGKVRSFAGRTDRGIFMELIGERQDAEELFAELKIQYSNAMNDGLGPEHVDLYDEAVASVREAVELNLPVGLCTGNFREVAMKKVETAGLVNIFRFGGFGGEHEDRNELPALADKEYRMMYNREPARGEYVIIGDTPNDIRCANYFGALSVAVTTGGFSREELSQHKPTLVVDSLGNPRKWLKEIGFNL